MALNIKTFEPGTYIEITDTMKGFRKIGLVTEGGDMYLDDGSATATPFPIYEALQPVAVGNALSWGLELASGNAAEHRQFVALQERLAEAGVDTITASRALFWARNNHAYDYGRALTAGRAASAEVSGSRGMMDSIITRAATA